MKEKIAKYMAMDEVLFVAADVLYNLIRQRDNAKTEKEKLSIQKQINQKRKQLQAKK